VLVSHSAQLSKQLPMVQAIKSTLWGALRLVLQQTQWKPEALEPSGFSRFQVLSGSSCPLRQRLLSRTRGGGFHQDAKQLENTTSSTMAGTELRIILTGLPATRRQMLHSCSMSTHQHGQTSLHQTRERTKFLRRLLSLLAAGELSDPQNTAIVKTNRLVVKTEVQLRRPQPMVGATQPLKP